MRKTLAEIAKFLNGEIVGDSGVVITGLRGIKEAGSGDLTFVENSKYIPWVQKTKASAILTPRSLTVRGKSIVRIDNPSLAFAKVASLFVDDSSKHFKGIHKTAIIAADAKLGKNVAVGACAIIENKVKIGDNTVIYGGTYVGKKTVIGNDCLFYPNVTLLESITIGNRVIIHSGTVIGSDGFGYVFVKGRHEKIPQIGTVIIEDDVEIGANVTVDRARFDKTFIGRGTKIDNLVQIAHNVKIGENCIIIAQVGISGTTTLEKNVILAGQVGTAGHITIGEGAIVASRSVATKDIPPHTKVLGYPAIPDMEAKRINACMHKLPQHVKTISELKKRLVALEAKIK